MNNILVFAGSYSQSLTMGSGAVVQGQDEGIFVFRLNTETGELTRLSSMPGEPNPTYLAIDKTRRFLYACNELGTFSGLPTALASAYSIDAASGVLTLLNRRITIGTTACHITLNDAGTHVLVANYTDSGICIMPIEADGSLGNPSCFLRHKGSSIDPVRQTCPHAHSVALDKNNQRILVPDLGTDEIVVYEVDWEKGFLRTNSAANPRTAPGAGPRHCVFADSGKIVYVINEMGSSISVFSYDEASGNMELLQNLSTLPAGFTGDSSGAAIRLHPNGKLLYGSNRGHDSAAAFSIDQTTGLLTLLSIQSTGGRIPRDFAIDPAGRFLIAANQESGSLIVFRIDEETGELAEVFRVGDVDRVACVLIQTY